MNITVTDESGDCCLVFEGAMTFRFSRDIENMIINSMRHHEHLRVDLSGVHEIDLSGIHLLGVLRSFGDDAVRIVAASPVVEKALTRVHVLRSRGNRHTFAVPRAPSSSLQKPGA